MTVCIYHVTGGAISRLYAFAHIARGRHQRAREVDEMGYCLDAPEHIPAGSTRSTFAVPAPTLTRRGKL